MLKVKCYFVFFLAADALFFTALWPLMGILLPFFDVDFPHAMLFPRFSAGTLPTFT